MTEQPNVEPTVGEEQSEERGFAASAREQADDNPQPLSEDVTDDGAESP